MSSQPGCNPYGYCQIKGCEKKAVYDKVTGMERCSIHKPETVARAAAGAALPSWDELAAVGAKMKVVKITELGKLPADVLPETMTWPVLVDAVHNGADFKLAGTVTSSPKDGMEFIYTGYSVGSQPYQIVKPVMTNSRGKKIDTGACHESYVFTQYLDASWIVLIRQSHAPCGPCQKSFSGMAMKHGKTIIVAFENGGNSMNNKSGTFIFVPLENDAATSVDLYVMPYQNFYVPQVATKPQVVNK
ncbi:hypothetical protein D3C81_138330 [compost metagenome]